MIKVSANLVNGSLFESNHDSSLYDEYKRLVKQGYSGKALVHELLTDDWGPPPQSVVLKGKDKEGNSIREVIPYT